MSDYESHTGKIRLMKPLDGETFSDQCKRLWVENGKIIDDDYEDNNIFYEMDKYVELKGKIWELYEHVRLGDEDDSYCRITKIDDDAYTFQSRFYNGGTDLTEMIEDEFKNLENE